jgi:putative ABC transport system permease protein
LFTKFEYQKGRKFVFAPPPPGLPPGRSFIEQPEPLREAVIGSFVAQKTGLKEGDKINPYHGVNYDESSKHEETYLVVGVLEPTNTPNDRVIFIPLEGTYRMKGHYLKGEKEAGETISDDDKEISAVMLKFSNPQAGFTLQQIVNKQGDRATLAWPIGQVMVELFDKIGWMDKILELVAYLVGIVASASILASIYNTMNERRREFAILRALGARRGTVFSAIVAEAATISFLGSVLGFVVYGVIVAGVAIVIRRETGVVLDIFQPHPIFYIAPAAMVLLGAFVGIVPALKAYGTDVASNLAPQA